VLFADHHKKKQEEEEEKARQEQERQQQIFQQQQQQQQQMLQQSLATNMQRFPSVSPRFRHQPYPNVRPGIRPRGGSVQSPRMAQPGTQAQGFGGQGNSVSGLTMPGAEKLVKQEPSDNNEGSNNLGEASTSVQGLGSNVELPEVKTESGVGFTECDDSQSGLGDENSSDTNPNIKLEALTDSDLELEITGVEPGTPAMPGTNESWEQYMSVDTSLDSSGAMGTSADMQGASNSGYSK